jgi:hypothetical protein
LLLSFININKMNNQKKQQQEYIESFFVIDKTHNEEGGPGKDDQVCICKCGCFIDNDLKYKKLHLKTKHHIKQMQKLQEYEILDNAIEYDITHLHIACKHYEKYSNTIFEMMIDSKIIPDQKCMDLITLNAGLSYDKYFKAIRIDLVKLLCEYGCPDKHNFKQICNEFNNEHFYKCEKQVRLKIKTLKE